MSIAKEKIAAAIEDAWIDTFKDRLTKFYNNEIIEDAGTADAQLRVSFGELKRALAESVTIVDEFFP